MSLEKFTTNPQMIRRVVNREGDGISRGGAPQIIEAPLRTPSYCVDVREKPSQSSETILSHTGPGAGITGGYGRSTDVQGFVSPTGNRVTIDNTTGADTITMHHHSGATVMIDADGSIHIISTGKKGFGVIAPKGDGAVSARGHLIIKGDAKITLETDGDLDLNVGGNMGIYVAGDMSTYVEGSVEEFVDGRKSLEVVKEHVVTVAGDERTTVAGESRRQVTGNYSVDIGKNFTSRSDENTSISAFKKVAVQSKEEMAIDSEKSIIAKAKEEMALSSKKSFKASSTEGMTMESKQTMDIKSTGNGALTSKGTFKFHSTGNMGIRSDSRVDVNEGGAAPGDPGDPPDPAAAPQAQYATAEMIIDNLTTVREAPDFPKNAKRMPDTQFVLWKNDGETPNPKAEAAARGNHGAGASQTHKEEGAPIDPPSTTSYDKPQGISGSGKSEKNPLPVPASVFNSNEKISRHVTVGMVKDIRSCSPGEQKAVLQEAMNTAWNVLDPLIDKYGSRVRLTSWFRKNTKNHGTGGAVDLAAAPWGNHTLTAEMAAWMRDNVPTRQLFLEKNNQGGIHIHVWAAPPGQGSNGNVLTCSDPQCRGKVAGIQPSFAFAALRGRSTA